MNWQLFINSLAVALFTALGTLLIGTVAASAALGFGGRARRVLWLCAIATLALPPFLLANCWVYLLGANGVWHSLFPVNLYSLTGTVWIMTLWLWPVAFAFLLATWQSIDPSLIEAEPDLRGAKLWRHLLLPFAKGPALQALAITSVLALNHFAIPALLQVKVLPAEMWIRFNTTFDTLGVLIASAPLVISALLLIIALRGKSIPWPARQQPVPATSWRRHLGTPLWSTLSVITALTIGVSLLLPLAQVVLDPNTWSAFLPTLQASHLSVFQSLWLGVATSVLILGISLITQSWRIGPLLWLFFLLPGVLTAVGLIHLLNRPVFQSIYQSSLVVLIAWIIRYLAIGWHSTRLALRSVDRDLVETVRMDTDSPWQRFRHAYWPQSASRLAAAAYVCFLLCLWDTETVTLLTPPGTDTLATRIFGFLHYGHTPQVNVLCLLLLALALSPAIAWILWNRISRLKPLRRQANGVLPLCLAGVLAQAGCSQPSDGEVSLAEGPFSSVTTLGARGTGLGQFNKPRSVTVDATDHLYVVDMTGRVQRFTPQGDYISYWQMPQTEKGKPKGMCLDPQGRVVVVEPHYSRVNHFSPAGELQLQWGNAGTNRGCLSLPRAIAITPQGQMVVSEYGPTERIQWFSTNGSQVLRAVGMPGEGPAQFRRPEGLDVDPEGRVYVADSCNHRIQVFSPDGEWLESFGKPGKGTGEMNYPYDVKLDSKGLCYVCEFGNSRIQVFNAQRETVAIIGGAGAEPGQFNNPWSIAFDSRENLYVADALNHRVQKLIRRTEGSP